MTTSIYKPKMYLRLIGGAVAVIFTIIGIYLIIEFQGWLPNLLEFITKGDLLIQCPGPPTTCPHFRASCIGVVMVMGGAITMWLATRKFAIHLTEDRFLQYNGRHIGASILYTDITRIYFDMRKQVDEHGIEAHYPVLIIESRSDYLYQLDIETHNWSGYYDVRQIMTDLIPRLPSTVVIDPAVQTYVETGFAPSSVGIGT